jgi:hypothetical protein
MKEVMNGGKHYQIEIKYNVRVLAMNVEWLLSQCEHRNNEIEEQGTAFVDLDM